MSIIYKKIDDDTIEITTVTEPIITKVNRDKAEIQTEFDHIPDKKAEIQKQLDALEAFN